MAIELESESLGAVNTRALHLVKEQLVMPAFAGVGVDVRCRILSNVSRAMDTRAATRM